MILLDLDDMADDARSCDDWARLCELKGKIPSLKVTLFTIPGMSTPSSIEGLKLNSAWVDIVQHGWHHWTNYECLAWTKADCKAALRRGRDLGFTTRGFKAPGWQISDGCYEALAEEGYWVADNHPNAMRLMKWSGLRAYMLGAGGGAVIFKEIDGMGRGFVGVDANVCHGHVGMLGGHNANALELIMPDILEAARTDTDFRFIREVME